MSHWPTSAVDPIKEPTNTTRPSKFHSYKEDKASESHEANANKDGKEHIRIDLYSLDVRKINKAFRDFRKSKGNWAFYGSTFFRDENSRNCSGLSAHLLIEGGINELIEYLDDTVDKMVSPFFGTRGSSLSPSAVFAEGLRLSAATLVAAQGVKHVITPSGIAKLAEIAKKAEIKKYESAPSSNAPSRASSKIKSSSKDDSAHQKTTCLVM
jgi:hypothetical protein